MASQHWLTGKTVVITRPIEQSGSLAESIRNAGGLPLIAPLLEIVPDPNFPSRLKTSPAGNLDTCDLAIFISPNAVHASLPHLLAQAGHWPAHLQAAAIGPGTASALASFGITNTLLPKRSFDSEGLLETPTLQASPIQGKRVFLFKGNGGRELLAETLMARGAEVFLFPCYVRRPPNQLLAPFRQHWATGTLDALLVSSSESLDNLLAAPLSATERLTLLKTPVFVPHVRIQLKAESVGFLKVILTPPTDTGLMAGLLAYNGSP